MPGKRSQKKAEKKKEKARKQHAKACKQMASNTTSGEASNTTSATMPAMMHHASAVSSLQHQVAAAGGDPAGVWGPLQDTEMGDVGLTHEALKNGTEPKTQWNTSDRKDFLHHVQCFAACSMEPGTATLEVVTDPTLELDHDVVVAGTVKSNFKPIGGEFKCFFQVRSQDPMGEIVFLCNDGADWGRVYLNTFVSRFAQADFKPTEDIQLQWKGDVWKP